MELTVTLFAVLTLGVLASLAGTALVMAALMPWIYLMDVVERVLSREPRPTTLDEEVELALYRTITRDPHRVEKDQLWDEYRKWQANRAPQEVKAYPKAKLGRTVPAKWNAPKYDW